MHRHVVMTSGGATSWEAARRVKEKFGLEELTMLYTDTLMEDEDLYRFLIESCSNIAEVPVPDCAYLQIPTIESGRLKERKEMLAWIREEAMRCIPGLVWIADGRTPWEVFRERQFIGNSLVDICSEVLKRDFIDAWFKENCKVESTTRYVGLDWTEMNRVERYLEAVRPWLAAAPLMWDPWVTKPKILEHLRTAGIRPPRLYEFGFAHNNCFAGETEFITDRGVRTLREMCGKSVCVLGSGGGWTKATVKSFGAQPLLKLSLSRYGSAKEIYTTADHRWFVRKGRTSRVECFTSGLVPGMKLASIYGQLQANVRPSAFGVAHGIVFGDGTRAATTRGPAHVVLCGDKDRQLMRWFPNSPSTPVPGGIRVDDLPRAWKRWPSLSESKSYLFGWLSGYFAADGKASAGEFILNSARRADLEFAKTVATRLGLATGRIRAESRVGIEQTEESELYSLPLLAETLREDFFLITSHREAFTSTLRKRPADWTVESVQETGRNEEVFCAVVPKGHAFALSDNVLTGNCGGACVKAGHGSWLNLLEKMPERFIWHAQQEASLMSEISASRGVAKPWTMLTDRRGGAKKPLSLWDLRERASQAPEDIDRHDIGGCGCALG